MDIPSLNRFLQAQEGMYAVALNEIRLGKKRSHWMWYIFPQLRGLGKSQMSYTYGINGIEEAKAYLAHPLLSARLTGICEALLMHTHTSACDIFGGIDARKLRSSMTLFALVSEDGSVFHRVLDGFFDGKPDNNTVALLA